MNFTTKALAAAVALAASATASAAPLWHHTTEIAPGAQTGSSFALYVWNDVTRTSYIRNLDDAATELGRYADFELTDARAQAPFVIAPDALLLSFLAGQGTDLAATRWGIIGAEGFGTSNMSITLSGPIVPGAALTVTTGNNGVNNAQINAQLVATASVGNNLTSIARLTGADSYVTTAAEFGAGFSANGGRATGDFFRPAFSATTIGSAATMFTYTGGMGIFAGPRRTYALPFVLGTDGTLSYVPVPAAVWLLGSALAGMAAVARRRAA